MLAKINRRSLPGLLRHCLNNRTTMDSLSRKYWPDFMTHAVAALNMQWTLESCKQNTGFGRISSTEVNEELKASSHVETERLQEESGNLDPPQKPSQTLRVCELSHGTLKSRD